MASSSKRVRKANYIQSENIFLAEKYEEFRELLDSKHKGSSTNKQKKDAWEKIRIQHEARFPGTDRSVEDLNIYIGCNWPGGMSSTWASLRSIAILCKTAVAAITLQIDSIFLILLSK